MESLSRRPRLGSQRQPSSAWIVWVNVTAPCMRTADVAMKISCTDFARFRSVWSACQLSRRSVAGFALTTSFGKDRCASFSARATQVGSVLCPHVRHLFGAARSRLVWHGKGAHEYNLTLSFPRMRARSTRESGAREHSLLVVGGQG